VDPAALFALALLASPPPEQASVPDSAPRRASASDRTQDALQPHREARLPTKAQASPRSRPFLVTLGITGMQAPIARTSVVRLDPRATGRSTTLIGGATSLRWVPRANEALRDGPWIGLDVGFRSGSVRFRDATEPQVPGDASAPSSSSIAHDLFAFESAALLYLAKSPFARLAVDAGGGGMVQIVRYDLATSDAAQRFGSGFVRLGASVEVLLSRVAFVFDLRGYGVVTDRRRVVNRGDAFSAEARAANGELGRAPVATLQTMLVGSAALAFRF
jgi:hypothetical protein